MSDETLAPLAVEVWSDVVCPWCYLGKRRLDAALAQLPHRAEVAVTWRSFELDPRAPQAREGSLAEALAAKYGMSVEQALTSQAEMTRMGAAEGIEYHFETARGANSFDAHRIIHLAASHGRQDEAKERMMRAYFAEAELISDPDTLVRLAGDVGISAGEAQAVLEGGSYTDAVRDDEHLAARIGITGVPYFVLDRRYGVAGAQPAEQLLEALRHAWVEAGRPAA